MAATNIPGSLPNPNVLPVDSQLLSTTLESAFNLGNLTDKEAILVEGIQDIEYDSMYAQEYEFNPSANQYYMDAATGLYSSYPIYTPAYTYAYAAGIQGHLVALLIKCDKGSCVLLNNGGGGDSIQYIPSPMSAGDFLFWADANEPLIGFNEDGTADSALGILGIQASTVTGVRLTVYTFYKFIERI